MGLDFSHCDAHWSYSGFSSFRHRLWVAAGYREHDLERLYNTQEPPPQKAQDDALYPLFNHSDCDGELTVKEMRGIVPRLRAIVSAWDDGDYDKLQATRLIEGMEDAIAADEPLYFQ